MGNTQNGDETATDCGGSCSACDCGGTCVQCVSVCDPQTNACDSSTNLRGTACDDQNANTVDDICGGLPLACHGTPAGGTTFRGHFTTNLPGNGRRLLSLTAADVAVYWGEELIANNFTPESQGCTGETPTIVCDAVGI